MIHVPRGVPPVPYVLEPGHVETSPDGFVRHGGNEVASADTPQLTEGAIPVINVLENLHGHDDVKLAVTERKSRRVASNESEIR